MQNNYPTPEQKKKLTIIFKNANPELDTEEYINYLKENFPLGLENEPCQACHLCGSKNFTAAFDPQWKKEIHGACLDNTHLLSTQMICWGCGVVINTLIQPKTAFKNK